MSPTTSDSTEGLPTAGPDTRRFDRYECELSIDGHLRIYDTERQDSWIQAREPVSLDAWR